MGESGPAHRIGPATALTRTDGPRVVRREISQSVMRHWSDPALFQAIRRRLRLPSAVYLPLPRRALRLRPPFVPVGLRLQLVRAERTGLGVVARSDAEWPRYALLLSARGPEPPQAIAASWPLRGERSRATVATTGLRAPPHQAMPAQPRVLGSGPCPGPPLTRSSTHSQPGPFPPVQSRPMQDLALPGQP